MYKKKKTIQITINRYKITIYRCEIISYITTNVRN